MIYNEQKRIILCAVVIASALMQAMGLPIVTKEDLSFKTNSYPIMVRTSCRMKPEHFSGRKGSLGYGELLCFSFGKPECILARKSGVLSGLTRRRKMIEGEYRGFDSMILFFSEGRSLLYKVEIEKTSSSMATSKDYMATITEIIADCKAWYQMEPVCVVSDNSQIVYLCSDDVFEIRIELNKEKNGGHHLSLSVMNKMVRDGKVDMPSKSSTPKFNEERDIEVSI